MASTSALGALETVVSNAIALISQLEATITDLSSQNNPPPPPTPTAPLDVLSLAHDAAILIRAHSTKISLLIINDPFTPTAIAKVIKELLAGPLPALATSAQLCAPARYTRTLQADLAWKNGRVLKELKALLSQIPKDGKILSGDKKTAAPGKGSIATTAVLWSACDDVVAFAKRGFAGNLVHKVEEGRDTVRDMMEELKEWGEEVDEEDDDENDDDEEVSAITNGVDNTHLDSTQSAQDLVDEWMSSERHIPRDDPDKIRERLEVCLRRIRLTTLLYQAAVKRRLKTLPKLPPAPETKIAARVDEVMERLKKLPDGLGNLAMAFYQLDPAEVDRLMEQCFGEAVEVSEILAKGWEGQEDEFTEWAGKFRVGIKK